MVTNVTSKDWQAVVLESSIPVIVDFWADWCGPCKMMAPVFEKLSKEYDGKVKFVKVNTEGDQELPAQFAVQSIPTLVILKGGKEVDRIIGFNPEDVMKQHLDAL